MEVILEESRVQTDSRSIIASICVPTLAFGMLTCLFEAGNVSSRLSSFGRRHSCFRKISRPAQFHVDKRSYIKELSLQGEAREKFPYIGWRLPSRSVGGQRPHGSTTDGQTPIKVRSDHGCLKESVTQTFLETPPQNQGIDFGYLMAFGLSLCVVVFCFIP